jgi:hypothetical protein
VRAQKVARLVHVFVALADNAHQGIVPLPKALGNGDDPGRNPYWGAATFCEWVVVAGMHSFSGVSKPRK